jgi:Polysaccharide lyase
MKRGLTLSAVLLFAMLTAASAQADGPPKVSRACGSAASGSHDVNHLPAIAKLPEGVSWMADWGVQPQTGGWYEVQATDPCRFRIDSSFKTWHGMAAARVEVDPGDDPLDLNNNSERAEGLISQTTDGRVMLEDRNSRTQFYATSYFFPKSWEGTQYPWSGFAPKDCGAEDGNVCNSWSIVLQFHLKSSRPWGFLFAAKNRPDAPERYTLQLGEKPQSFSDGGPIALGKWTDLVMQVQWDADKVSVWRRDEGQQAFVKVVDEAPFTPPSEQTYLKQGLYRGGAVGGRTDIFWIGPTVRASSFGAAAGAAFGDKS